MTTFTIDADNNITAHAAPPKDLSGLFLFSSQKELNKLAAGWMTSRMVEIWNSFAGVPPFGDLKPVKKFTDRKAAVSRIWKAIQILAVTEEEPATPKVAAVKPAKAAAAAKESKVAKEPKPVKAPAVARVNSKQAKVLELARRPQGVELQEIMSLMGWQAHTVRGFMAGTVKNKLGLDVESFKTEAGERAYRIAGKGAAA